MTDTETYRKTMKRINAKCAEAEAKAEIDRREEPKRKNQRKGYILSGRYRKACNEFGVT